MIPSVDGRGLVGVGIVGAGTIFEQHARAWAGLVDRARLLAVADVDGGQLVQATSRHVIPFAYRDHRRLLDRDDIDLVTVCTPPRWHEEVVVEALEAGKHVVCEKPLAPTLEAADRILAVARRFPGRLSTVYQCRWLPEVRRAVWLRDHGCLGALVFGRFSRYARYATPEKKAKPGRVPNTAKARSGWWGRWDVAGGGAAMTQLIHELDLMVHLLGPATGVSAVMDTLKGSIESEDTCAATVRFASGAIACVFGTVTAHRSTNAFDLFGTLGSVHAPWALEGTDPARREEARREVLRVYPLEPEAHGLRRRMADAVARFRRAPAGAAPSTHTAYLATVVEALVAGKPLPVGPAEARASLELCTGIYASALAGAPVALPLERTSPCYGGVTARDYAGRTRGARPPAPEASRA